MYTKTVAIKNATGLHARPASDFVVAANQFQSAITIKKVGGTRPAANAKSIIFVLAQGLAQDTVAEISANGPDEVDAVDALVALIEGGFGEL